MAIETLGAALREMKQLFAEGVISGLPDRRLLDLFIEERNGEAFEVLVARHGPMVLSACRGVLRDPSDVEDAFQATFLVLVKKARGLCGCATRWVAGSIKWLIGQLRAPGWRPHAGGGTMRARPRPDRRSRR